MAPKVSKTDSDENIGWKDKQKNDPKVIELINYLNANNGIQGLDIVEPSAVERAVELFHRDGFVVVSDILNAEQIDFLAVGCDEVIDEILALDTSRYGNRGSHRYSFGGSSMTRSQLHHPAWQMLLEVDAVHTLLTAIFGSPDYALRAGSGDFCLPGATDYQPLHPDTRDWEDAKTTPFNSFIDPRGHMSLRDLPSPYICVNFLPQDVTKLNGPTRQIPGTQNSRARIPNLKYEPEWMKISTVCPAPAGAIMIRDVRAWHGGTPNVSDTIRSIPNLEFYAPWFREPMVPSITYRDYKKLSERSQRLAKFCVADSREELVIGPTLQAP